MPIHVIVGAQWGDEGKGRVVDYFAAQSDITARYAGGDNAGHTVRVGDETYKLHLVPSGILYPNGICVLGGGMVINPLTLMRELKQLADRGIDIAPERIWIAENAHLITPAHVALDGAREAQRGSAAIGTTKRGIGPAYTDKAARSGLRAGMMANADLYRERLTEHLITHNKTLEALYGAAPLDVDEAAAPLLEAAAFLAPYLTNVPLALNEALRDGKSVLAEGAQGTLLDLDHGSYPYVTSSSATVGGVMTGLGVGPKVIERVTGVVKAYSTRVGGGPFPTELTGALGDQLRGTGANPWDEFGTTTGRPRRTGWLDVVVLRYAARINGLTDLIVTKLDILSGFDSLQIADRYTLDGTEIRELPSDHARLADVTPIYGHLPGWHQDIMQVTDFEALPDAAQDYIRRIETLTDLPIRQVTVGPARAQAINR
ncbi:MAG: adenylosuccinate synthase [Chloroflexi bacterium]|nr:adenylosuccinate synthase [Chloroflexota bacterium]